MTARCKVVVFINCLSHLCVTESLHYNVCYDRNGTEQDVLSLNKLNFSTEVA